MSLNIHKGLWSETALVLINESSVLRVDIPLTLSHRVTSDEVIQKLKRRKLDTSHHQLLHPTYAKKHTLIDVSTSFQDIQFFLFEKASRKENISFPVFYCVLLFLKDQICSGTQY